MAPTRLPTRRNSKAQTPEPKTTTRKKKSIHHTTILALLRHAAGCPAEQHIRRLLGRHTLRRSLNHHALRHNSRERPFE